MKIAVIDDGIYLPSALYLHKLLFDMQCVNGKIETRRREVAPGSHGTIVADLICSIADSVQIGSIQIIYRSGRCRTNELVCALLWCLDKDIDVIHMSIGTSDWHDFPRIEEVVFQLTGKLHMIAAKNNNGNLAAPADLPGVWSVSWNPSDEPDPYYCMFIKKDALAWEIKSNFKFPLKFVQKYGFDLGHSNSFQAAAVTGFLIKNNILLKDRGVGKLVPSQNIRIIKENISLYKNPIKNHIAKIPTIWVHFKDDFFDYPNNDVFYDELCDFIHFFHTKGYYAVGLLDTSYSNILVKRESFFLRTNIKVSNNLLAQIKKVYNCDLIIIFSKKFFSDKANGILSIKKEEVIFWDKDQMCTLGTIKLKDFKEWPKLTAAFIIETCGR